MSDQPLVPKPIGEMTRAQQDAKIASLKAETVIPILEAARDVIKQWDKDGTLHQEMHGKKLGSIINDIAKLLTAVQPKGLILGVPVAAPGDSKDPSWFRANSATNLTDHEREQRRKAVDAEVLKES